MIRGDALDGAGQGGPRQQTESLLGSPVGGGEGVKPSQCGH